MISVIGFGGLSEVLSVSIIKAFTNLTYNKSNSPRLDIPMYGISGLALLTLFVSMYLMEKFKRYFKPVRSESTNILSGDFTDEKMYFRK